MARHHKSHKNGAMGEYAGMESRDRNQYRSGEYVDESRNGYADMPQHVEYKRYAPTPFGMDHYLDDGIGGIDRQVAHDRSQVKKGLQTRKSV